MAGEAQQRRDTGDEAQAQSIVAADGGVRLTPRNLGYVSMTAPLTPKLWLNLVTYATAESAQNSDI